MCITYFASTQKWLKRIVTNEDARAQLLTDTSQQLRVCIDHFKETERAAVLSPLNSVVKRNAAPWKLGSKQLLQSSTKHDISETDAQQEHISQQPHPTQTRKRKQGVQELFTADTAAEAQCSLTRAGDDSVPASNKRMHTLMDAINATTSH